MAPRKDKREKRRGEKRSKVMEKPDLMKKIKKISKIHRAAFRELRSRPQEISVTHQHQQIISRIAEKKDFSNPLHTYITRRGSARSSAIYLNRDARIRIIRDVFRVFALVWPLFEV